MLNKTTRREMLRNTTLVEQCDLCSHRGAILLKPGKLAGSQDNAPVEE